MIARLGERRARTVLLICVLTVAALALDLWQWTAARSGSRSWFDEAVCAAAQPVQGALLSGTRWIERSWEAAVHARELEAENAELKARVAALEDELSQMVEARTRKAREAALLSAHPRARGKGVLAQVIGIGAGGWSRYFTIGRGSEDGIHIGDVAVTRNGLVGQVYAVTRRTARVLPLTEPASGVAVRIQRTRDTGVLKGTGDWRCEVRYLDPESDVRPGDQVITSGLGGIFPRGLRVGTASAVEADPYTPGKIAPIEPAVELRKVEEVLVVPGLGER